MFVCVMSVVDFNQKYEIEYGRIGVIQKLVDRTFKIRIFFSVSRKLAQNLRSDVAVD